MYNFKKIEKKWQKYWEDSNTFKALNNINKPKYYYLIEFPYPSGVGLHVGHVRSYTALDAMARKKEWKDLTYCSQLDGILLERQQNNMLF